MINEANCGTFVPADDINALQAEILRYFAMTKMERLHIGERGSAWIQANRTFETLANNYISVIFP